MSKKHTPEFSRKMTEFYTAHKEVSLEKARKHAAKLGYDEFSKGAHDQYRKKAGGKAPRSKRRKAAAGIPEAPKRCWMDLSTGKFRTDFGRGKPGTQVAIYRRVATGVIRLAYPPQRRAK
jgi:hypothetical protein